jgi:hypothetical protein
LRQAESSSRTCDRKAQTVTEGGKEALPIGCAFRPEGRRDVRLCEKLPERKPDAAAKLLRQKLDPVADRYTGHETASSPTRECGDIPFVG